MGNKIVIGAIAVAFSCLGSVPAKAKQTSSINQKENVELYSGVGDSLVRVTLKESLPNAFGGADVFGRKRDRGFIDIRYVGQTPEGFAVFHRKSVDIYSNETTMSRGGISYGRATVAPNGYGATVSGYGVAPPKATVQALPPDTIEIVLDLSKNRVLTVEGRRIDIASADAAGVSYKITKR
jgi:hypothetical protein